MLEHCSTRRGLADRAGLALSPRSALFLARLPGAWRHAGSTAGGGGEGRSGQGRLLRDQRAHLLRRRQVRVGRAACGRRCSQQKPEDQKAKWGLAKSLQMIGTQQSLRRAEAILLPILDLDWTHPEIGDRSHEVKGTLAMVYQDLADLYDRDVRMLQDRAAGHRGARRSPAGPGRHRRAAPADPDADRQAQRAPGEGDPAVGDEHQGRGPTTSTRSRGWARPTSCWATTSGASSTRAATSWSCARRSTRSGSSKQEWEERAGQGRHARSSAQYFVDEDPGAARQRAEGPPPARLGAHAPRGVRARARGVQRGPGDRPRHARRARGARAGAGEARPLPAGREGPRGLPEV